MTATGDKPIVEWPQPQIPEGAAEWPEPQFEVELVENIKVPVRDGIRLATDLYFPKGVAPRDLPCILLRTPYDKNEKRSFGRPNSPWTDGYHPEAKFAEQGFVVAVQDVRGKYGSEGQFNVSADDGRDGDDTINWLVGQSWSNRRVGTYGCSYLGENQLQLAAQRNPHHRAAIARSAGGVARYFGVIDGGAFMLSLALPFFARSGLKRPTTVKERHELGVEGGIDVPMEALWWLPTIESLAKLRVPPTDYEDFLRHPPGDPWWRTRNYMTPDDRFATPILLVDGWFDYGPSDTLNLFELLRRNTGDAKIREAHRVIIAPSQHCQMEFGTADTVVGDWKLGNAKRDFFRLYVRWFDHWLRDGQTELLSRIPRVQFYVMGLGRWRSETDWPLTTTVEVAHYLSSGGNANSRGGDGALGLSPSVNSGWDQFAYDPSDPVPSIGGPLLIRTPGATAGPCDQTTVETRSDVLCYTSDPLSADVEVTGRVRVVLHASSSCSDTDFVAKLVDVAPDGTTLNVQDGILRARYRGGYDDPRLMVPGQVYELTIDLHATSTVFRKGHRIRLQVTSSNFPLYDRNLNTGNNNFDETVSMVAINRVHHGGPYPSRLILPTIDGGAATQSASDLDAYLLPLRRAETGDI